MKKLAFFFMLVFFFWMQSAQCQEKDTISVPACTPVYVPPPGMMLSRVEEQPYLKQCENIEKNQRTTCSGEILMSYLTDGLKHPGIPPNVSDTTRALVVVQFYIDTMGYIDEPVRIARDINLGYGSQVLSRVEKMRKDTNIRWQPARLNGKKVKVQYNMPVYYKHFKREQLPPPPPPPPPPTSKPKEEDIFIVVDRLPRFPGCSNSPKAEKDTCAQRKFKEYIFKQLRYPREAYRNGKEGDVIVEFVIDKDGSLYDAKVTSDPGYGMGEAALHAIEKMRKDRINWVQSSRGRVVRVLFYHKISFRLDAGIPVEK